MTDLTPKAESLDQIQPDLFFDVPTSSGIVARAPGVVLIDPHTGQAYEAGTGGGGGGETGTGGSISGADAPGAAPTANPVYVAAKASTNAPTETDGTIAALSVNLKGALRVVSVDTNGNELDYSQAAPVNVNQWNGNAISTGAGVSDPGTLRVTLASDIYAPVQSGGKVATALPAAGVAGATVPALFDKYGRQVVRESLRVNKVVKETSVTTTAETSILPAAGAGLYNDVYAITVANNGTVDTVVTIADNTQANGGTGWKWTVKAGQMAGFRGPPSSARPQTSANAAWYITSSAATTLDVSIEAVVEA